MQIIHYVPCSCQLLDSCECGVTNTGPTPPPPPVYDCPNVTRGCGSGSGSGSGFESKPHPEQSTSESEVIKPLNVVVVPGGGGGDGGGDGGGSSPSELSSVSDANTPLPEEISTVDKIYYEARKAGIKLSFFLANFQFTAFTATLTSQWNLNLLAAVIITNLQNGFRSLLVILVAWPSNIFLGNNFTRIFSFISYIIGVILIYGTYPTFVSKFFVPGLVLVTLGQCMNEYPNTKNENDEDKDGTSPLDYYSFDTCVRLALKKFWDLLKRYWIEVIGFIVAVFLFPGQEKALWIIIWISLASFGFNLVGQLCIKLRDDGIDGTFGCDVLREALNTSSKKWTRIRYVWRDTIDKKHLLRTLRLSLVFLPYIIMSEVADNYFFQQVQEMKPLHIFGKAMPTQAFALLTQFLGKLVQWLSHWVYTKTDDSNARRTRFYGTLRVGLAMVLTIPCFVIASVVETKRWEDKDMSVLRLIPQLILIAIVNGLANDGIDCFFELELPDSIGRVHGFLFVKGIESLGKFLCTVWNAFWSNVTRTDGNPGWLDERDGHRHQFDRYYSVMAIFADVSCIIYVCVAYRYSVKSHKWNS